jgi:hypothetical protein
VIFSLLYVYIKHFKSLWPRLCWAYPTLKVGHETISLEPIHYLVWFHNHVAFGALILPNRISILIQGCRIILSRISLLVLALRDAEPCTWANQSSERGSFARLKVVTTASYTNSSSWKQLDWHCHDDADRVLNSKLPESPRQAGIRITWEMSSSSCSCGRLGFCFLFHEVIALRVASEARSDAAIIKRWWGQTSAVKLGSVPNSEQSTDGGGAR